MTNPVIISPAGNTRFVSGRGPNRTVGRDRPVSVPSGVQPFFEDNFSNGQVNPANGFTYSNDRGTLDQSEVVTLAGEGLTSTDGATYALRTRYLGQPLGSSSDNGQVNFSLGRSIPEVWMEWRFYIPTNYIHRDQPVGKTENNKFFILWGGHYENPPRGVFSQLELNRSSTGGSLTRPIIRHSAPTVYRPSIPSGSLTNIFPDTTGPFTTFISSSGPIVPGTWNTVQFYTKRESSDKAFDGIWRLWVNGTIIHNITGLPIGILSGSGGPTEFASGYLWGAANANFDDPTYFYTRYIKFYDTDPGWV